MRFRSHSLVGDELAFSLAASIQRRQEDADQSRDADEEDVFSDESMYRLHSAFGSTFNHVNSTRNE